MKCLEPQHMLGLRVVSKKGLDAYVYCTEYAKEALASDKLNLSKYHGTPIRYSGDNVEMVHDGEKMVLFEDESQMEFFETPGHNPGCLTMVMGDFVFTGDAYIPGIGVNTIPPKADKELAKVSLERILKLAEGKTILSGHQV